MSDDMEALATGVKATAEAMLAPFTDLLQKIAGPAAEEFGLSLRDHARMFRFKREIRMLTRVKEMVRKAGFPPQQVPLKLIVPLIESGSLEDDDRLQDKWAALLANACGEGNAVRTAFADVLRQLSAEDAQLLDYVSVKNLETGEPRDFGAELILLSPVNTTEITTQLPDDMQLSMENLSRLGIISSDSVMIEGHPQRHWLTKFGLEFVKACKAPKNDNE